MRIVLLPSKRIARLLKNNSRSLHELEERGRVEIFIREQGGGEGIIEIEGESENEWIAEQALKAIDLGFEPKHAFKLFNENYFLEVIDVGQAMRGNERAVQRQKARIIGEEGKAKKKIEELSEALLALSDDERVGIIGEFEEMKSAKEAILRLLEGANHAGVFAFLKKEKDLREARRLGAAV